MTDKEIKFKCTKDCKKKNTSECYELNCIEGQTNVLEQLSRKTQECEEIKEKYEALKLENQEGYEIVAELKHECEEHENKIKKLRKNLALEIEARVRYRKVLEEIEKIAKSFNKNELCFYKEINECDCCDMVADCNYLRRAKILYIINVAKEN